MKLGAAGTARCNYDVPSVPGRRDMLLLCLIRFQPIGPDVHAAFEAAELFAAAVADAGGQEIHREELQAMVQFNDLSKALQLLSDTLMAGQADAFAISAGLAQGIHSKSLIASSLSGFTEGSIETLFAVTDIAGPQEVAISAKLSSLVKLSAPDFVHRFIPTVAGASSTLRHSLVMGPLREAH